LNSKWLIEVISTFFLSRLIKIFLDAIAAVEKCGGKFTAAFYDRKSIELAVNPVDFFLKGKPVLKRQLPPPYLLKYYVAPETRGYLADKDLVNFDRQRLAKVWKFYQNKEKLCLGAWI